jgi:hypothetical protein
VRRALVQQPQTLAASDLWSFTDLDAKIDGSMQECKHFFCDKCRTVLPSQYSTVPERQVPGQEMLDLADRVIGESRLNHARAALHDSDYWSPLHTIWWNSSSIARVDSFAPRSSHHRSSDSMLPANARFPAKAGTHDSCSACCPLHDRRTPMIYIHRTSFSISIAPEAAPGPLQ